MPRWLLPAVVLTLAVSFPSNSATAGLFSHDEAVGCAPTCAAPIDNCVQAPTCCAPTVATVPSCYAPTHCAPACAPVVGPACAVPCDGYYENCVEIDCCGPVACEERECCVKRFFGKLMDLERRKNRCLKDTFFGWCDDDCDDCDTIECAPVYYYEPGCAVPYQGY